MGYQDKDVGVIKIGDVGFKIKEKEELIETQTWIQGDLYLTPKSIILDSKKEQIEIAFQDFKKVCVYVSKDKTKALRLVLELEGYSVSIISEKKEELKALQYFLIPIVEVINMNEEIDNNEFLGFLKLWSIGTRNLDAISYFCGVDLERAKDVKEYALRNGYVDEKSVLKCGEELIHLGYEGERA
ncbi:MAG: hypothetical protein QXT63_00070 [Thermoplasmata archaeon]